MKTEIIPQKIKGEITAPPSKSYAHRMIVAACLSDRETVVKNVGTSKDILATVACMKALGASCDLVGNDLYAKSFCLKKGGTLPCGESGSTLRFLLPVCAALGADALLTGTPKLLSRPSEPLINALNERGAAITTEADGYRVNGKLTGGNFVIDGSISSQYITGLLLAFPLTGEECSLTVTGKGVSLPYIEITLGVMESCGIRYERKEMGFSVFPSSYVPPETMTVEGDYSGAAFMLAAGAIGGEVTVKGLEPLSKQGDAAIVGVLGKFGAKTVWGDRSVTVKHRELHGITLDCEDIPDLVQIISVVAAFARGETVLKNIDRLVYKESDRIQAIVDMLTTAGIETECDGNTLKIRGGVPKGGRFDSGNDHRTAMSAAILGCFAQGKTIITGAEAVSKSYPDFYEDLKKLGGEVYVGV